MTKQERIQAIDNIMHDKKISGCSRREIATAVEEAIGVDGEELFCVMSFSCGDKLTKENDDMIRQYTKAISTNKEVIKIEEKE